MIESLPNPERFIAVASWSTEVVHNLPSSGRHRASVQTGAVLRAPVLLVEVDNCTESADIVAAKFDRYPRFFRLKAKDHKGREAPVAVWWRCGHRQGETLADAPADPDDVDA